MLFDLGGTLFSYTNARQMGHAILEAARGMGLDAPPAEIASAWGKASNAVTTSFAQREYFLHQELFHDTLESFARSFNVPLQDHVAERFHTMQRDAVVDHLPLRADTLETLCRLKDLGLYLAIVSNIDDDYLDPLVQ